MTNLQIAMTALAVWAATPFVALLVVAIGTVLERRAVTLKFTGRAHINKPPSSGEKRDGRQKQ